MRNITDPAREACCPTSVWKLPGVSARSSLVLLLATLFLHGCASLSKTECLSGDWQAIGKEDASLGHTRDRINAHTHACRKHQESPDAAAYEAGFNEGLRDFCVSRVGYRLGVNGRPYHYACPATLEREFLEGYINGLDQYRSWIRWRYHDLDDDLFHIDSHYRHLLTGNLSETTESDVAEKVRRHRQAVHDKLGDLRFKRMELDRLIHRAELRFQKLEPAAANNPVEAESADRSAEDTEAADQDPAEAGDES